MVNKKNDLVSKKLTLEFFKKEYEEKGRSFGDIASDLGTYANRLRRAYMKLGGTPRDHSEAQKSVLATGKAPHPTLGKRHKAETREKISARVEESWKNISDEDKEARAEKQRKAFLSQPKAKIAEMRTKAMRAIREARDTGSKLERAIVVELQDKGVKVEFHRQNLVANEKLEADIYLPELRVVIEIDGIGHRENVFGRVQKQRFADKVKNGLLMTNDFIVIRVADTAKTNSQAYNRRLWKKVEAIIDDIENIDRPNVLNVEDN